MSNKKKEPVRKAEINGAIVQYDFCTNEPTCNVGRNKPVIYLGQGNVHSIGGKPYTGQWGSNLHFWK